MFKNFAHNSSNQLHTDTSFEKYLKTLLLLKSLSILIFALRVQKFGDTVKRDVDVEWDSIDTNLISFVLRCALISITEFYFGNLTFEDNE